MRELKKAKMRYLLMHYTDADGTMPAPNEEDRRLLDVWRAETDRRGARVIGERLSAPKEGAAVTRHGDELLVSDGPFADTKEWICGFDLIECANLNEAIQIASTHPTAVFGRRIEVRPLQST